MNRSVGLARVVIGTAAVPINAKLHPREALAKEDER